MTTVTISMPETLKAFVEEQVRTKGYGNVSETSASLSGGRRPARPTSGWRRPPRRPRHRGRHSGDPRVLDRPESGSGQAAQRAVREVTRRLVIRSAALTAELYYDQSHLAGRLQLLRHRRHAAAGRPLLRRAPGRPRPPRRPPAGEYCYVLNSRQMGKSSLCVRTMARLREEGIRTAFLDLTKFGGRNLTAEQWYAALLAELGRELGLRAECLAYLEGAPELPRCSGCSARSGGGAGSGVRRRRSGRRGRPLPSLNPERPAPDASAGRLRGRDRRHPLPALLHGRVLRRDPPVLRGPGDRAGAAAADVLPAGDGDAGGADPGHADHALQHRDAHRGAGTSRGGSGAAGGWD